MKKSAPAKKKKNGGDAGSRKTLRFVRPKELMTQSEQMIKEEADCQPFKEVDDQLHSQAQP